MRTKGFSAKRETLGFTLVELLVVISIIAILSVIGITIFASVQKSARDTRRRADLKAIANALEQYKLVNGLYPAGGWFNSDSEADLWIPGLDDRYMAKIPRDPNNTGGSATYGNGGYTYNYFAYGHGAPDGTYFMLVAHLEAGNSNDAKTQCTTPDGHVFNFSNSSYKTFMVCNQQ